jgi:itaconate CoA-transferase
MITFTRDEFSALYRSKLVSSMAAAALVPRRGNLAFGMGPANPPQLLSALVERISAGEVDDLHIHYQLACQPAAGLFNVDFLNRIQLHPNFMSELDRDFMKRGGVVDFMPSYLWQLPIIYSRFIPMDVFMITVSPMDKHGYFSLGTSCDYSSTVAKNCKTLLVEVNDQMPRVFGDNLIHVTEVDGIVENSMPLIELPDRPLAPEDEIIGKNIAAMIPDGACLQFGIGGVPNAVAKYLTNHKNLGIHTEMLTNVAGKLYESGALNNSCKSLHRDKTVFTFCWGTRELFDFIDDNPAVESYPASHINDPAIIAQNDNVVSINAMIEIDLFGQVNSESLGGHEFSGVGGQRDFISGAFRSRNGLSFLASAATVKNGTISKIVPKLSGVMSDSRMEPMYIVTEHGMINLKGKTSSERALGLIEIAAPAFRQSLLDAAKQMGLVK